MARYAEVAVELPVYGLFHYAIPERLSNDVLAGRRALVPFGSRGVTGVVVGVSNRAPGKVQGIRELDHLLDDRPQLSRELVQLCLWVADYYEAPPGEVMRAALPAGTRIRAPLEVELTALGASALGGATAALRRGHRELLAALQAAGGALEQRRLLGSRRRRADISALVSLGYIRYRPVVGAPAVGPRSARFVRLTRPPTEAERAQLARAARQLAALEVLLAAGGEADVAALRQSHARLPDHLRALQRRGLVEFFDRPVAPHRLAATGAPEVAATVPRLTAAQETALAAIGRAVAAGSFAPFLLHGVTGSGKTEVYLGAIAAALAAGKSALVLVPEISLTPQLAARFRARFGDQVAVLHSGLSPRERYDEWDRLRHGTSRIALGARSAVFAPLVALGIVVVDEEHDASFKQEEGVKYNARDVALLRAQRAGVPCVLGSATPSLESYRAAELGRYHPLSLPERATPRPLPDVELIDLRVYRPEGEAMLSAPMSQAISATLAAGDQIILFLNRRGFATFVLCQGCGHAFHCKHCSVAMTYHREKARLLCHHCAYWEAVPRRCPCCQRDDSILHRGLGTERVAQAVKERFATARVARLDRDAATGADVAAVLARVARREVDILVGTQMVTKGHDFPGVTLVGVLCADQGLSFPDFRAGERTFQLLTQVAGRAGRGARPGRVIIQSFRPDATPIAAAASKDYEHYYRAELAARRELGYPPFGHLVAVRFDGADGAAVAATAAAFGRRAAALAKSMRADVVLRGPCEAPLARLKGRVRWHVWFGAAERRHLRGFLRALMRLQLPRSGVRVAVDVDPQSTL